MKKQNLSWLFRELPDWIKNGLVTEAQAGGIRKYYSEIPKKELKPAILAIFGILGTVLIGGGIILLLAHNWYEIPRFVRTMIAILPLAAAQIFAFWIIYKDKQGFVWRESAALFLLLMLGASIALIGQIYHIPGSLENFLFIWLLCSIPVCYFLKSNISVMLCLAGAAAWAGFAQNNGGNAVFLWVFFLSLAPYLYLNFKKSPESNNTLFLSWVFIISLCVSIGITLEKVIPGLWIIIYSAFFSLLFLLDREFQSKSESLFKRPFLLAGAAGTGILSSLLTMDWPWEKIGFSYYRGGGRFQEIPALADYAILAILAVPAVILFIKHVKKEPLVLSFYFALLPAAIIAFLLPEAEGYLGVSIGKYLFGAYTVILALSMIILSKLKIQKWDFSILGLLLLAALQAVLPFRDHYYDKVYWILTGCFFCAVIFMQTGLLTEKAPSPGRGFIKFIGTALALGFLYAVTFNQFSWYDSSDFHEYFRGWYILTALLYLAGLVMIWLEYRKEHPGAAIFIGILPLIAVINYFIYTGIFLFNLYFLAAGIALILFGIRKNRTAVSNGGICLISLLVGTRFFDQDLSFLAKGIAFVILGALFIGMNAYLYGRKIKGETK